MRKVFLCLSQKNSRQVYMNETHDGTALVRPDIEKIVKQIERMPSLSPTVGKILEIANDPKANPKDLNYVISMDPVLTARILKLVNSTYFALSTKVTQILRAIILLGLNTIKNLALSTAVLSQYGTNETQSVLEMDKFWEHCLGVAAMSKMIGKANGVDPTYLEEYFAAGLLHDLGKIVLDRQFAEQFTRALKVTELSGDHLYETEERILGVSHCKIGAWLSEKWMFSEPLREAIAHHHHPDYANDRAAMITYAVHLSNEIVKSQTIGVSGDPVISRVRPETWSIIRVSPDETLNMSEALVGEILKARTFLKVKRD